MNLVSRSGRAELERIAADCIAEAIEDQARRESLVALGLCGGRSVAGICGLLARRDDIPWGRVHIFLVDERRVPPDHADSNFRLIHESLAGRLLELGRIAEENLHPFVADESAPDRGAEAYGRELTAVGGRFHIALLSAGEDGHVAALYPAHHSVADPAPLFLALDDSPKPPLRRMTCSHTLLARTEVGLLLFFGEAKRDALRRFLDGDLSPSDCPAKIAQSFRTAHILTDQELA